MPFHLRIFLLLHTFTDDKSIFLLKPNRKSTEKRDERVFSIECTRETYKQSVMHHFVYSKDWPKSDNRITGENSCIDKERQRELWNQQTSMFTRYAAHESATKIKNENHMAK